MMIHACLEAELKSHPFIVIYQTTGSAVLPLCVGACHAWSSLCHVVGSVGTSITLDSCLRLHSSTAK